MLLMRALWAALSIHCSEEVIPAAPALMEADLTAQAAVQALTEAVTDPLTETAMVPPMGTATAPPMAPPTEDLTKIMTAVPCWIS